MTEFNRKAGVLWSGDSRNGVGMVSTESQALYEQPFNYQTRFGGQLGTNPEELLAAAHAACFSMALASTLKKNGFEIIDPTYAKRVLVQKAKGNHAIIGGENYGQGSSREYTALAPRYLGLRVVIAKSFARIHLNNLVNFGILPVTFDDSAIYDKLKADDVISVESVHKQLREGNGKLNLRVPQKNSTITASHTLTPRLIEILFSGA